VLVLLWIAFAVPTVVVRFAVLITGRSPVIFGHDRSTLPGLSRPVAGNARR
jgi:hypothetical protein